MALEGRSGDPPISPGDGKVFLVGAGPGDPGLITRRGEDILRSCNVLVYDRLVSPRLVDLAPAPAERIFVGKEAGHHAMPQEEINRLLVDKAQLGHAVCRLKGGDPYVFGRGGEEALYCRQHGVPFEVVPGIPSAIAAPAYAGIPLTHRGLASSFAVVTGHTMDEDGPPENLPQADTLVFLMGVRALPAIVERLVLRGMRADTPVAVVQWGTLARQQTVTATLETVVWEVERAGMAPPALVVVGRVVNLREHLRWFDNRPLWGKCIIVTRAREQASGLVRELEQLGAAVMQCPSIRVEPLQDYGQVDSALKQLERFDWVVFTSANAVEHFWRRLDAAGLDSRVLGKCRIAAIGPASAQALQDRSIKANLVPASSISEEVARALLEQRAAQQRVLVVRALEAREVLEQQLSGAGAEVTVAPCYRNVSDASNAETAREALRAGEVDWVTFTSSSTVTNFVDAVGQETVQQARGSFRVASIGPVTAETATRLGLAPDAVAEEASVEALARAIVTAENVFESL